MTGQLDLGAGGARPPAFEVTIFGSPKPAGSKRGFAFKKGGKQKIAIVDANPHSRNWKLQIAQVCGQQMEGREVFDRKVALEARFVFYVQRPQGHSGKRGLRPSAPPFPVTHPDLLKLARAIEDSMSKVVYEDDSQIVDEILRKRYCQAGPPERVEIMVTAMPRIER